MPQQRASRRDNPGLSAISQVAANPQPDPHSRAIFRNEISSRKAGGVNEALRRALAYARASAADQADERLGIATQFPARLAVRACSSGLCKTFAVAADAACPGSSHASL